MFCRFCGSTLPDDSNFCHSCGKALTSAPLPSTTETAAAPAVAPVKPAPPKTKSPAAVGSFIIGVLLIAGVLWWAMNKPDSDSGSSSPSTLRQLVAQPRTEVLLNLANPDPPFFHLTERGRQALQNLTRDPSNPAGYLRHLSSIATLDPVASSYLSEGLDCYVAGLFKAAAVMTGAAAERIILGVRDAVVQKLTSLSRTVPTQLNDWRIRVVSDAFDRFLEGYKTQFRRELREEFDAYWSAFTQQIRATRNDAGHPESIEPVTPDTVHASLLIFPELARLASGLTSWVTAHLA